jgi:ATP-dependent helicase/DNAse subunit B
MRLTDILFVAPSGAKKRRDALFKEIVSCQRSNNYSSVRYLTPNNFIIGEVKNSFYSFIQTHYKKSAFVPFQFQTIRQYAEEFHESCEESGIISDRMRVLILAEIIGEKSVGYATILADLFKKITHYLPESAPDSLKKKFQHLIFEEKAADRALSAIDILQKYESLLKRKKLIDRDGVLKKTVERRMSDAGRKHANSVSTLIIDGFFDPSPLELKIITRLMDNAETVMILAEERTGILNYLTSLKREMTVRNINGRVPRKTTFFYSYPSIEDEVEGIAKNIKKLIIEGAKPWEITVSFPILSKYLPMMRRVLYKYGIPASIGEYSMSSSRPLMALAEMLTCIEEDYPRSDFLSLLTSPHFPAIPSVVRERAVSYSYNAGIIKGRDAWLSIKDTLLNAPRTTFSENDMKILNDFHTGIEVIIGIFENIKRQRDAGTFIDGFESALSRSGFFDSLYESAFGIQGEKILGKIRKQLSEFRYFASLYKDHGTHVSTPVFYLKYLLTSLTGSDENRNGVKIVPFELAARCETKALFFGGMMEGDLPSRPGIDPILPENVKKELGMPHLEYYLKRQKRYYERLLNASQLDPYFSCPSADGEKVFLPSPFLDWEKSISPPELNIFSDEEALIREGAVNPSFQEADIFHDKDMFRSREAFSLLNRRVNAISKGFFSVTDIDFYRKCPLRFYIEKILGLEILIPPQFEIEARLWGNLAHKTMEFVFRDGVIDPEDLERKIPEGLARSLKHFPIGNFWEGVAKEIFRKLLPSIKEQETNIQMQGFRPFRIEEKLKGEIGSLRLKGKVDRVDIKAERHKGTKAQSAKDEQRDSVILIDYKTGNIDRDSLQLPLYAAMWQESFNEPVEKLGYYSLKDAKVTWYPGKKATLQEYVESAVHNAEELSKKIRKGIFTPEPFKGDECRYCYHKPMCSK